MRHIKQCLFPVRYILCFLVYVEEYAALPGIKVAEVTQSDHGYDHDKQTVSLGERATIFIFEGPNTRFAVEIVLFLQNMGLAAR